MSDEIGRDECLGMEMVTCMRFKSIKSGVLVWEVNKNKYTQDTPSLYCLSVSAEYRDSITTCIGLSPGITYYRQADRHPSRVTIKSANQSSVKLFTQLID